MAAILNFRKTLKKSYRGECDCKIWIIYDFKFCVLQKNEIAPWRPFWILAKP